MRTSFITRPTLIAICAALSACGGGGSLDTASSAVSSADIAQGTTTAGSLATNLNGPVTTTVGGSTSTSSGTTSPTGPGVTSVQLTSSATTTQTNAATTFGQVFAQGDVPNGSTVVGKTASGAAVPTQVDVKARHADGSVRHAVITVQLPSAAANQSESVSLVRSTAAATPAASTPAALLNSGFTASMSATIGGTVYTASADSLLKSGKYTTWLSGSLVNEWIVSAPLKSASGVEHPHLTAQFAIRYYAGSKTARVDVTVENGWAYEAAPQNATYNAQVMVGGKSVYNQAALTHYHHARWRKVFWWGNEPKLDVKHNIPYLIATKAIPNYDQTLGIKDAAIASWNTKWTSSKTGPMNPGLGHGLHADHGRTSRSRFDAGMERTVCADHGPAREEHHDRHVRTSRFLVRALSQQDHRPSGDAGGVPVHDDAERTGRYSQSGDQAA
jgi:hypothetical protein